jgi:hypothetical protein
VALKSGIWLTILAVALFRLIGPLAGGETQELLANFSPVAAFIMGAALYFPRRWAGWWALALTVVPTLILLMAKGWPFSGYIVIQWAVFGSLYALATTARGTSSFSRVLGTVGLGSLTFYLVMNTASFAIDPGYSKSLAGWFQAQTVGLPGFPPAWMFFVKTLVSDLSFASLLALCFHPFAWRKKTVAAHASTLAIDPQSIVV